MGLIPILIIFGAFLTKIRFSSIPGETTVYPLSHVSQFMKKCLYILFLRHERFQFNQEVSWFVIIIHHGTITKCQMMIECHMLNLQIDFLFNELIYKPGSNIFTEVWDIPISRSFDDRHVPQCKNQMKDPINASFSVCVI